jgi:hypothetical protein
VPFSGPMWSRDSQTSGWAPSCRQRNRQRNDTALRSMRSRSFAVTVDGCAGRWIQSYQRQFVNLEIDFEINNQLHDHPCFERPWTCGGHYVQCCYSPNTPTYRSPDNFLLHLEHTTPDGIHDDGCRVMIAGFATVFGCQTCKSPSVPLSEMRSFSWKSAGSPVAHV